MTAGIWFWIIYVIALLFSGGWYWRTPSLQPLGACRVGRLHPDRPSRLGRLRAANPMKQLLEKIRRLLAARRRAGPVAAAAFIGMGLAACSQVATFTANDALNAGGMAAVAGKSGDTGAVGRAACYGAFGSVATGIAGTPANSLGVFTGVEAGIEIQGAIQRPECQMIAGQVMLWALRKAPGGNLLP